MNQTGITKFDSDEEVKEAYKWLSSHYYSDRKNMIVLRESLLRYDEAKDEEARTKALNSIKNFCHWDHNHTKPTNLKKIKKAPEEAKGKAAEDTSEEEDPDIAHYPTSYKAEVDFSKVNLVDQLIKDNNAQSIHPVISLALTLLEILPHYRLLFIQLKVQRETVR